jgi:hypothetical protein
MLQMLSACHRLPGGRTLDFQGPLQGPEGPSQGSPTHPRDPGDGSGASGMGVILGAPGPRGWVSSWGPPGLGDGSRTFRVAPLGHLGTRKCTFRVAFWIDFGLKKCTFRVTYYVKIRGFRSPTLKISILHPGLLCSQSRPKRFVFSWRFSDGFDLAEFQLERAQEQRVFEKRV